MTSAVGSLWTIVTSTRTESAPSGTLMIRVASLSDEAPLQVTTAVLSMTPKDPPVHLEMSPAVSSSTEE